MVSKVNDVMSNNGMEEKICRSMIGLEVFIIVKINSKSGVAEVHPSSLQTFRQRRLSENKTCRLRYDIFVCRQKIAASDDANPSSLIFISWVVTDCLYTASSLRVVVCGKVMTDRIFVTSL